MNCIYDTWNEWLMFHEKCDLVIKNIVVLFMMNAQKK